jgi:hypothetical protein
LVYIAQKSAKVRDCICLSYLYATQVAAVLVQVKAKSVLSGADSAGAGSIGGGASGVEVE